MTPEDKPNHWKMEGCTFTDTGSRPPMLPYAHPVGWPRAALWGFVYGTVVAGLAWCVWRAATLAPVGSTGYVVCAWLFGVCFTCVLMLEATEREKIRKGQAVDIRSVG